MSCPRCNAPAEEQTLREFGGVCPKCLLDFSEEQDAPAFPNLEIVEMIGQGGMGVVYKAVQKNLGRTVALKVLSPQLSDDPEFVERFTREARALATLSHPNIVGIHDSGIHDRVPYLVMEYVDGTPLRKLLASGKITPVRVLELIPQICDALQYAHAHGVVHRDVKPENILVDREGRVKIADFGLAKLASIEETRITKTGYVMGSPHYMAPEQLEHSGRVDHRADIYSLGVVFYEMLTGELPLGRFKPPSEKSTADRRLDPVVLKSLEREPDDRWQSADEVKERVTNLESRRVILTGPQSPKRGGQPSEKSMWLACAILVLLAIAMALEGQDRSSVIWTGFGAAVCGVVALSRMGKARPQEREPLRAKSARPPIRVVVEDPLKRAAIIMSVLGAIPLLLGLVLSWFGLDKPAILPYALALFLLFGAFVVSLVALVRHAMRRASGGSTGWAVALIVIAMLLLAGMLSTKKEKPAAVTVTSTPKATAFRLEDAWPRKEDLPAGLTYNSVKEGAEVVRPKILPAEKDDPNTVTIMVGKPWKDMLPDLRLIRRAEFLGGRVTLYGFEFRTEFARRRWEKDCRLTPIPFEDGRAPEGKSFFHLSWASDEGADKIAAIELLVPLLRRKMREAADR